MPGPSTQEAPTLDARIEIGPGDRLWDDSFWSERNLGGQAYLRTAREDTPPAEEEEQDTRDPQEIEDGVTIQRGLN
jgi:hypothetical protein